MGGRIWLESPPARAAHSTSPATFGFRRGRPEAVGDVDLSGPPRTRRRRQPGKPADPARSVLCAGKCAPRSSTAALSALAALDRGAGSRGRPLRARAARRRICRTCDGFEVARGGYRESAPRGSGRVMMLSSSGQGGVAKQRCRDLNISHHLTKPIKQTRELLGRDPPRARAGGPAGSRNDPGVTGHESARRPAGKRPLQVLLAEDNPVNQQLSRQPARAGRGHRGDHRREREGGPCLAGKAALRCRADGRADAGDGRLRSHGGHSRARAEAAASICQSSR